MEHDAGIFHPVIKGLNEIQIHYNGLRIIALCTLNKFDWQYNLN